MPTYRLIDGYGSVMETFDAPDDGDAERRARAAADGESRPARTTLGERAEFHLEQRADDGWQMVTTWVPMPGRPTPPTVTGS
jgi:hypothetical protein